MPSQMITSTFRCAARPSSLKKASIAAQNGLSSSRTTSRSGRRYASTSARSCTTSSAREPSRARHRDAYLVKCDHETTTQNDIDLGIVNILVAFAPLKPAEFVIIQIQQLAGQIQV